ncbi:MAG: acyl-CoA dehydrogenase family protein [Candidatus Eisenbacteria bacterium]
MPFLNDQNRMWQEKARQVAEKVVRPLARKYDDLQEYPWEIKEAIAEAGLLGVWIPKEYGGAGGSVLDLCLVIEQLSRACGGVGVMYCVNALGSFPILVGANEEQKTKWLPKIASGEKLIAFCLSEKYAGSDAQSLRLEAKSDGAGGYVINGEKKWTTNGGAADLYTVFAVTDPASKSRRISAFLVEKGTPGFTVGKVEDKMGIRCVPVVETVFKGVKADVSQLLGGQPGFGFHHAMGTLDLARPGVAAQGLGLAQGALEYAMVYSARRQQFGAPVNSFQMIQQMLADMAAQVEAARQLVYASATCLDKKLPSANKMAAMAKLYATDTAMKVTTDAVQIFGGYGYMRDYPIEKYMRDAKITQIYEGTNQVQRLVVARNLVKETNALAQLLDAYIPREVQVGYNDPATLAAQKAAEPATS